MKKMTKKVLSMVLLLGLILSSFGSMVAQAAQTNDGKITITNAKANQTYTLYRVFDLNYNETIGAYTYTAVTEKLEGAIKGDSNYSSLDSEDVNRAGRMIIDETPLLAKAGQTPAINPYDFSKWLLEKQLGNLIQQAEKKATTDGKLVFENLPLGYYLVKSSQGSIVSLTTTDKEAEIVDKNTPPTLSKQVQGGSVGTTNSDVTYANIDEEVTFTLKFTVQKYGNMDYILTDILPAGLEYTGGLTMKADGLVEEDYSKKSEFNNTGNVTVDYNGTDREIQGEDNKILAIKFPKATVEKLRGKEVTVTYKAKLNNSANMSKHSTIGSNMNNANLQYDTLTDDEEFGIAPASADVRTTEFQIKKFRKDEEAEVFLPGAGFRIYDAVENGNEIKVTRENDTSNNYFVSPDADDGSEILPIDKNVIIKGLKPGTYYIEETTTPDGFNPLQKRVALTISADGDSTTVSYSVGVDSEGTLEDNTVKIENKTGAELPETGGMGRTMLYVIGGTIFVASLVLLITKKRMDNTESNK